jgi:AcrR family transcriptional regulator
MPSEDQRRRRAYHAPAREAAAARTRAAIVAAARDRFEQLGWTGTTIAGVAAAAGVSSKTVEAGFGTKAALLQAAVEYAIRGDVEVVPMRQRPAVRRMEAAADAKQFLRLHAAHVRTINERSARLARAVEVAAGGDPAVSSLWGRMNENRAFAVRWAASTLLAKRGRRRGLRRADAIASFWVALDWGTYRTLTEHSGLSPAEFERWLRWWYAAAFLDQT